MELMVDKIALVLDGIDVTEADGVTVMTERVNGYRLALSHIDRVYVWQQSYQVEDEWVPYASTYAHSPQVVCDAVQQWYQGVLWLLSVTS